MDTSRVLNRIPLAVVDEPRSAFRSCAHHRLRQVADELTRETKGESFPAGAYSRPSLSVSQDLARMMAKEQEKRPLERLIVVNEQNSLRNSNHELYFCDAQTELLKRYALLVSLFSRYCRW